MFQKFVDRKKKQRKIWCLLLPQTKQNLRNYSKFEHFIFTREKNVCASPEKNTNFFNVQSHKVHPVPFVKIGNT